MSSHWAPCQCWHKARWFTPVVSGTKQFSSWPALWIKWHSLGSIYSVSFWLRIQHRILPMLSITKTTSHQVMGQSIYSEGLSMLMKDKAKGQAAESMAFRLTWIIYAYFMWTEILKRAMSLSFYSNLESFLVFFFFKPSSFLFKWISRKWTKLMLLLCDECIWKKTQFLIGTQTSWKSEKSFQVLQFAVFFIPYQRQHTCGEVLQFLSQTQNTPNAEFVLFLLVATQFCVFLSQ